MNEQHVTLAHGNGGRFMRELIEQIFARHLGNPGLDTTADATPIELPAGQAVFTTDGFIVQPLEFPGGDIGALAVHGTTNDLAVAGADPLYLTLCLEGVINAFVSYWSMREPEEDLPTRIEKMQKVFLERIRRPPHAPGPGAEEQDRR